MFLKKFGAKLASSFDFFKILVSFVMFLRALLCRRQKNDMQQNDIP